MWNARFCRTGRFPKKYIAQRSTYIAQRSPLFPFFKIFIWCYKFQEKQLHSSKVTTSPTTTTTLRSLFVVAHGRPSDLADDIAQWSRALHRACWFQSRSRESRARKRMQTESEPGHCVILWGISAPKKKISPPPPPKFPANTLPAPCPLAPTRLGDPPPLLGFSIKIVSLSPGVSNSPSPPPNRKK